MADPHMNLLDTVNKAGVLYRDDVVVRGEAVKTIRNIANKVADKAYAADYMAPESFDETQEDYDLRRMAALEEALRYATEALQGIETALGMGQGGYISPDAETSLFFHGWMMGAVIDRGNGFSVHT